MEKGISIGDFIIPLPLMLENDVKIYVEYRKYRKPVTVVEGIPSREAKTIVKTLKKHFACGGTYKNGKIELQGNHKDGLKVFLSNMGFKVI